MELKWIVYITINLCNGKFYIGVHNTNPDVFDGYLGKGIYRESNIKPEDKGLAKAIKKYGAENFRRTTIAIFPGTEEGRKAAFKLEGEIVNPVLLRSKNCYNLALGGFGSIMEDTKKVVYKFDLNGNFLKSYDCIRTAALEINAEDLYNTMKAIRNNCLNTTNSSFGYFWSYKKVFDYKESNKLRKIAQYTPSGKFLRYFNSITEAEEALQISTIGQALRTKGLAANYQWRYYEGNDSDISPLVNVGNKNKVIPISMFDKNMNHISDYDCVLDCVKDNPDLSTSQINRVLKGIIKSHKGYIFKYKDEDIVSTS